MPRYLVSWEIDIEADQTLEAARQAWTHMRRPDSIANVFTVVDESGNQTQVDLQEIDEDACHGPLGAPQFFDGEDRSGESA